MTAVRIQSLFPFRLVSVLLFSVIVAGVFTPCSAFASDDTVPGPGSADDGTVAAIGDDPAAVESEGEAGIPPLLYSDSYRPAGSFPDRVQRSVASHPWMRVLPFAGLVALALVAARFLGRRRREARPAGSPDVLERMTVMTVGAFLLVLAAADVSHAQRGGFPGGFSPGGFPQGGFPQRGGFQSQVYTTEADGVASFLGSDREILQKDIDISGDLKQVLQRKLGWTPGESSVKVYHSKAQDGAVEAYAFVLSELLPKCGGTHKYCIKVSSKGEVEGVQILELNCHHSFGVNSQWFLNQFKGLNAETAGSTRIDAVTQATLSSDLTRDVVRLALALFDVMEGRSDA